MQYRIEGGNLPALFVTLNPGELIVSEIGGRTWMRGDIETETKAPGGAGKIFGRMVSGESMFLSYYTARSNAEIAFTSSFPGRIMALELKAGESVICQKGAFLCATSEVQLSVFLHKKAGAGFFGGEGFIMQKITGPGTAFVEIDGYSPEYNLAAGEKIVCDTGTVALMDATCTLDIQQVKGLKNKLLGGEGFFDTVVTGPGKVYMQTMSAAKMASLLSAYMPSSSS